MKKTKLIFKKGNFKIEYYPVIGISIGFGFNRQITYRFTLVFLCIVITYD